MNPSPTSPFRSPGLRSRSLVVVALLAALAAAASLIALRTTTPATVDALAPAASVTSTSSSGGLLGGLLSTPGVVTTPVVTTAPAAAPVAAAPSGTKVATPATTTPAAMTDLMAMPATSDVCTGLEASVDVFLQHLYAAHLETGVGQQVTDALNLNQYLKTHLVLVENMLKPLLGGTQQTLNAFLQHVYSAHLETNLGQQVADALSVDQYVKTHTVWVESLIKPLVGADLSSC